MAVIKKQDNEFLIYEETKLSILVAVSKSDQKKIKKYWKTKDKSTVADTTIAGFPFVQTDEQESLKIDFSQENQYEIVNLQKFD